MHGRGGSAVGEGVWSSELGPQKSAGGREEDRKTHESAENTDIGSVFRALAARASGSEQQRR